MTTTEFIPDDDAAADDDEIGTAGVTAPKAVMQDGAGDVASGTTGVDQGTEDVDDDGWEEDEALPPPRGTLMSPLTWILVMALFAGGGFAFGVTMEKSHATQVAQAAVTSQIAALRNRAGGGGGFGAAGGGTGAGTATGTGGFGGGTGTGTGGTGGGAGTASGSDAGSGSPAVAAATGTIKLVDGDKVYVQDAAGNVIIVTAGTGVAVTRSASGTLADLQAGQSVVVQGTTNADGTVTATAIASSPTASGATTATTVAAGASSSTPTTPHSVPGSAPSKSP